MARADAILKESLYLIQNKETIENDGPEEIKSQTTCN
jgi:hypothetical protein